MPITYGASNQPAQSTFNYDSLVATSVGNYRKTLIDNVSTQNLFLKKIMGGSNYESADGGLFLAEDLMYDLAPTDSYEGMDVLSLAPTEGISQAQFGWAQCATPISISERDRKINKHRIVDLVSSKIMQAEISIKEFWGKTFLWGSLNTPTNDIRQPYVSPSNGSTFVNPLFRLVSYTPTTSMEIGGINQADNLWWRNASKTCTATTGLGLIQELLNLFNTASRGAGGSPDMVWTDQITWELISVAYYSKYRTEMDSSTDYPWPTLKWRGMEIVWDEYMPNVAANSGAGSTDTTVANGGTLVMLNTKFMKIRYESETNFVAGEFSRPVNQDAKYKHILWMGNTTINQRRKQAVMGNIPRTLTFS
jgi:hypothetical protein